MIKYKSQRKLKKNSLGKSASLDNEQKIVFTESDSKSPVSKGG